MSGYTYDAFISYSHHDMKQARWLQRRLESFHIPRGLDREHTGGARMKIFRDQTDLAGAELQSSLEREMEASRYLIVICSPAGASSRWVNEEIRYFCSIGRADRIIPFIIEGEPNSDTPELECFPPVLRSDEVTELLGVNVHEIGKNKAFLKTASVLLDIRFNRLADREKQRRLRTALVITGITVAALTVTGILLLNNIEMIKENQVITQKNQELSYDIYAATMLEYFNDQTINQEGVDLLRVSAEAGNTEAMMWLAKWYLNASDSGTDPEKGFQWYLKAAEGENVEGMRIVGLMYILGTGVDADPEKAVMWFTRAFEAGDAEAAVYLGYCYQNGSGGLPVDASKAFEYFRQGAEGGNILALMEMANCYHVGYGVEKDDVQAFNCQKELAERGEASGMYNLGLMYENAIGTEEDPLEAYVWYRNAADAGWPAAMRKVGWCIENRYGVDSMERVALEWYAKAAEAGDEEALQDIERIKNGSLQKEGNAE